MSGNILIFVAIFFCKPHGMMEYWNNEYGNQNKKKKQNYAS